MDDLRVMNFLPPHVDRAAAEEALPAEQMLHSAADSNEKRPAGQGLHAADMALEK